MADIIEITILEDGTIRTECGKISAAQHLTAEGFLREAAKLAGGPVKITHKHGSHGHSHTHSHGEEAHQH